MSRDVFARIITSLFRLYWRHSRGLELTVQVVVRDRKGALLLIQDTDGRLQLPAGRVEAGEGAHGAAARVFGAFAGSASEPALSLAGLIDRPAGAGKVSGHMAVFSCVVDGDIDVAATNPRVQWVLADDLPPSVTESGAFHLAVAPRA